MSQQYKLEVFLPLNALDDIRNALYQLDVGHIGKYTGCMSWYKVYSSWKPNVGAKPYLGKIGEMEEAEEYKLEFRCDLKDIPETVRVIKVHHPYEEVCINAIPLLTIEDILKNKKEE